MTVTADAPAAEPAILTQPGVYEIPEAVYHGDPVPGGSLSASGAKRLLPPSCPARFRYEQEHPVFKATFDFGSAAHKMVLGVGPDLAVIDAEDWRTKAAKDEREAARLSGRIPVLRSEHAEVMAMAAALREHPVASALFDPQRGGKAEQSLFWPDAEFGIWRRARLDWMPDPNAPGRFILGDYKGLALDTPIPTPAGWSTMRDLRAQDQVFDSAGRVCTVTAKSEVHYRTCYRIRFDDGSSVICDDEHLWMTTSGATQNKTKTAVRTTDQIRQTLKLYGQCHHRVQVAGPLELPEAVLPIDSYVLGCWLGDGTAREGQITGADPEIFDRIAERGYSIGPNMNRASGRCPAHSVYGLRRQLRLAAILGHKAIPDIYLRSSYTQRLDLLRGLMDTDGSWNSTRSQAVFTSADKSLALSVRELACSLGQRAVLHVVSQTGFGLTIEAYRVTFTPTGGLNPFALSRKAQKVGPHPELRSRRRVIVAVEETLTVPTQCIAVDSPDSTYLCTEFMIPTHNTCIAADKASVAKSVANYGYYMQDAWYIDAVAALGLADDAAFLFVFQEKNPPYLVNVAELDYAAITTGREANRLAMEIYRDCKEVDRWPGYGDEIELVSLPAWARGRYSRGEF